MTAPILDLLLTCRPPLKRLGGAGRLLAQLCLALALLITVACGTPSVMRAIPAPHVNVELTGCPATIVDGSAIRTFSPHLRQFLVGIAPGGWRHLSRAYPAFFAIGQERRT